VCARVASPLNGQVALVTGAASGLGAATARVFAEHGARVICGNIDEKGAQEVADEIGSKAFYMDVAEPTSAGATVKEIFDSEGRIDILVNNAGVDFIRSATEMTLAEWDRSSTSTSAPPGYCRALSSRTWSSAAGARSSMSRRRPPRRAGATRLPTPPENLQPPENVAACILFMVCQPAESVIHELIVTPMTETSYP